MPVQKGKNLKALQAWFSERGCSIQRQSKWNHYVVSQGGQNLFEFFGDINFAVNYDLITKFNTVEDASAALREKFDWHDLSGTQKAPAPTRNTAAAEDLNKKMAESLGEAAAVVTQIAEARKYVDKPVNFSKLNNIPVSYDGYYFPAIKNAVALRIRKNRSVMITGPSGAGKTEMITKLADLCGATVVRINFHVGISESQLVGKYIVKDAQTKFIYGYLPMAMKNGWWLLLDEIDYAQPENLAILQPVLEGNPLVVVQNEGEVIVPHPDFRLFATGNTKGRGDSTNSFSGTNFLNASFLDRFSVFEMDYTDKERVIVDKIVGDSELSKRLVSLFKTFRKASDSGEIVNAAFSTRRLVQIADVLREGECLIDALRYEVFSRYTEHESNTLLELTKDVFDATHYLQDDGWKLGTKHHDKQSEPEQKSSNEWSTELTEENT